MTPELQREWNVTYLTVLGHLCGAAKPGGPKPEPWQDKEARKQADEHIEALELQEWNERQE